MSFDQIKLQFPDLYQTWQNSPHKFQLGDRYPVLELFEQASAFWQEILPQHLGKTILLVGHSGINRALISTALSLAPACYHYLQQGNCGITVLNISAVPNTEQLENHSFGNVQLESMNITSHLAALNNDVLPAIRKGHIGPRILLVRHGETDWNRDKRFQGQIDVPLNSKGDAQAQLAAEFLSSVVIDKAFSSPMLRPKQTAVKILEVHPNVSLQLIDDLQEISHGKWEGKLESEIEAEFPGQLEKWQMQPEAVQMPEGENLAQVWQRATQAWQEILTNTLPGETVLVVAHDAVNKALLCLLFNLGPEHFWTFKQGNGGVSVIDYVKGSDRPPVLQAMNITTHLSNSILDTTAAGAL